MGRLGQTWNGAALDIFNADTVAFKLVPKP